MPIRSGLFLTRPSGPALERPFDCGFHKDPYLLFQAASGKYESIKPICDDAISGTHAMWVISLFLPLI